MKPHDATEEAYKNGYEKGIKDFAERLKEHTHDIVLYGQIVTVSRIDNLVREKLTELISTARFDVERICNERFDCEGCPAAVHEGECKAGYIADDLIANGVTIQKWIPVTERLPEENGYYLCVVCVSAVNQRKEYRRKILFWEDNVWIEMENGFRTQKPLYWMPLPEPPKGSAENG